MAHESIEPSAAGPYFEGDYLDIPHTVEDDNQEAVDLTGATAEFLLKDELTDDDADALLTKSGDEDAPNGEVTFTDATNGEVTFHIETGDTDDVLTSDGTRIEEDTFKFVIRITDGDGRRVSTAYGDWTIHAT